MTSSIDLLFGKPIKFSDKVSLKVPTVEEVAYTEGYSTYVQPLTIITRQLFSPLAEVDELEQKFPTIWKMAFDDEGSQILSSIFNVESGTEMLINSLSYWTGLDASGFRALSNMKIINEENNWVVDEAVFNKVSEAVKEIVGYELNEDLLAPKNMSPRQLDIWQKTYKGRLRNQQKNSVTLADKIIILSVSMESYIPIDEIIKMSIYHFNKLYDAISEKEAYEKQWQTRLSPKFEGDGGAIRHWKEKI